MRASIAARASLAAASIAALLATPLAVPRALAHAPLGVVGSSLLDLDAGAALSRRGDETLPTASLIKAPLFVTVYDAVEQGMLALDDRLRVLTIDKVPASGQLQFLHDGIEVTARDAAGLMTITTFGRPTNVAVHSSVEYGLGVTTPNEMVRLFARPARGAAISPAAGSAMLETLAHNEDDQLLQRFATLGRMGQAVVQAWGTPPIRR